MKIGICQFDPIWENPEESIKKLNYILSKLEKVDVLIFPEMTLTGFTMNSSKYGEQIDGISVQYFINLAMQFKTDIFCGIIEKDNDKFFNSLFHIDNNGLLTAVYRKIHPFTVGEENKNYQSSSELIISKVENVKFGFSICYDLRFPELFRFYAKKKIDIIVNIANWPIQRIEHYTTLLKARAIENQCFVIGVNRVGKDEKNVYPGMSLIINPMGQEIFRGNDKEGIFYTNISLDEVQKTRNDLPFLDDIKLL